MPQDIVLLEPGYDPTYFMTAAMNGAAQVVREDRVRVVNHSFVYKPPRAMDPTSLEDTAGELLSVRLARGLDMPAIPMIFAKSSRTGCVLVSVYRGEREAGAVAVETVVNLDKVHAVAVFEQWVMNADDQERHLRASEVEPGKHYVEVYDHGHTFHTWNGSFPNADAVMQSQVVTSPSSPNNPYRVTTWTQIVPGIEAIASVKDEFIDRTVDGVVKSMRWALGDHAPAAGFLSRLDERAMIWKAILKRRRDQISEIMRAKYASLHAAHATAPRPGVPA